MVTSVMDVTTSEFSSAVVDRSHQVPVVVDLWAEWCGPCKTLGPILERLAANGDGSWLLAKVDVDSNPDLARTLGVQGIPTVVAFRDGREVDRFTGALPEQQVRAFLDGLLPSTLDLETSRADALLDGGDVDAARATYRSVLAQDPAHEDAGVSLAGLLLEDGHADEALDVLSRLAQTEAVRRLQALARLGSEPDGRDDSEPGAETTAGRLAHARTLARSGSPGDAVEPLMAIIGERVEPESEDARGVLLDVFEVLGPEDRLVADARRRLANGIY